MEKTKSKSKKTEEKRKIRDKKPLFFSALGACLGPTAHGTILESLLDDETRPLYLHAVRPAADGFDAALEERLKLFVA